MLVALIANPASRRGRRLHPRAERALRAAGIEVELLLTERPGHAAELAVGCRDRVEAVFVLGGDGTVMEVAGALAHTGVPIGVLAGGTGNLLARALGIPLRVERAVPVLLSGDRLRIDLGRFDTGRRFAIAAGVGIDARMVAQTPGWLKRRLGVLAYTLTASRAVLAAVSGRDRFTARITLDGEAIERPAIAVMVANFGAVLADTITLGPGIASDDGVLDLCIFSPRTVGEALRVMRRLLAKDFGDDECILYRRGRHIRVETDPPGPVQADGELLGDTPFEVTVEPLAAELLVPARRRKGE
ncbi:MAG TPA: diacylglycerol kinase family protein [Gemmatimonadaceae bacterium]|nr:diacylglycerol kinase family protein [Gemmatimonadaceae bacterium]